MKFVLLLAYFVGEALSVAGDAPMVHTLPATDVGSSSAVLHGELSGPVVTTPTRFYGRFEWGPGSGVFYPFQSELIAFRSFDFTPGGPSIIDFKLPSRLPQFTQFHYRFVVFDTLTHEEFYGEDQVFTTQGNDPPVAPDGLGLVDPETLQPVVILLTPSDPDGGDVNYLEFSVPENGGVVTSRVVGVSSADGTQVIYTPPAGFTGSDRFTYTVIDRFGATETGRVEISTSEAFLQSVAGTYETNLTLHSGELGEVPAGTMRVSVTATGAFTGSLDYFGALYPFAGTFRREDGWSFSDYSQVAYFLMREFRVARFGQAPFVVQLLITFREGRPALEGILINGDLQHSIEPQVALMQTGTAVAETGRYTAVLPAVDSSWLPQGDGYAAMSVKRNAAIRIAGRTGDGTPFSRGTRMRRDHSMLISARSHLGNRLAGGVRFAETAGSDCTGSFKWYRPQRARGAYSDGFNYLVGATGARYTAPPPGGTVLPFSDPLSPTARLDVFDHANAQFFSSIVPFNPSGLTVANFGTGERVRIRVNRLNGVFKGVVVMPQDLKHPRKFSGVVLQKQNRGAGVAGVSGSDGRVELVPQ